MMNFMSGAKLPAGEAWVLRPACAEDLPAVLTLYKEQIGRPHCVWTDGYPGEQDITTDFSAGKLFVWGKGTEIVGAVAVVSENELNELPFWEIPGENAVELARVAIRVASQGQGYAQRMLSQLLEVLRLNSLLSGWKAVHLLAARENPAAVHLYEKLSFVRRGECAMFGNEYFGFEYVF